MLAVSVGSGSGLSGISIGSGIGVSGGGSSGGSIGRGVGSGGSKGGSINNSNEGRGSVVLSLLTLHLTLIQIQMTNSLMHYLTPIKSNVKLNIWILNLIIFT